MVVIGNVNLFFRFGELLILLISLYSHSVIIMKVIPR